MAEELLLSVEKLIYGGEGLAHAEGSTVFVPYVLPGEQVRAAVRTRKKKLIHTSLVKVEQAAATRIAAPCPHFQVCGGCQYQHTSYEHQLEIKRSILTETLRRIAKLELLPAISVHPSLPWNYRNRSRLQIRVGNPFLLGYFEMGSHQVLAVEECPISSPLINRGISGVWQSGRAGNVPQGLREVEFFATADDTQMLVELGCDPGATRAAVRAWAEDLCATVPAIAGVVAFREAKPGGIRSKLVTVGVDHLLYGTSNGEYRVSAGSFFQTNRYLIDELVSTVKGSLKGNGALDLYAGVGLFSTALAGDFHHIVSVESSQLSSADLAYNQPSNGKAVQGTTEQYLDRVVNSEQVGSGTVLPHIPSKPDLAVVDPPRVGLGDSVAHLLANLGAPRIVYVSCDPATLGRDLVPLLAAGYNVEQLHLVDLFPQTYHIESVVHLVR